MSIIIDTTRSELEAVIKYARIGANNCMIANSWEVADLVRCRDCKWFNDFGCAIRIVDESDKPKEDDFCSFGERRSDND